MALTTIEEYDILSTERTAATRGAANGLDKKLKFTGGNDFHAEVRRRVDEYFQRTGKRRRDCPQMYLKAGILLGAFALTYSLLVFVAETWWQALPLAVLLGLITAAIGFNLQHDGGHQAFSNSPFVNKLMAFVLDVIGGSSYLWHYKHAVFHHTYVNIDGHDTDIELGILGRLAPHQRRYWYHRWQHIYLWPLYGLMAINWHLHEDFREMATGRVGDHRVPRARGWNLALFLIGKVAFFALAFGIPLLFHPLGTVLLFYAVMAIVLGTVLSVVFQLAHCVEQADFPLPEAAGERIEKAWAEHQVATTVDFSRRNRLAAWLLGGLNFQIEHHLFPRISHVNYPAISEIVEQTCREYNIPYNEHRTFWSGVASHYRWLKKMGAAPRRGAEVGC